MLQIITTQVIHIKRKAVLSNELAIRWHTITGPATVGQHKLNKMQRSIMIWQCAGMPSQVRQIWPTTGPAIKPSQDQLWHAITVPCWLPEEVHEWPSVAC